MKRSSLADDTALKLQSLSVLGVVTLSALAYIVCSGREDQSQAGGAEESPP